MYSQVRNILTGLRFSRFWRTLCDEIRWLLCLFIIVHYNKQRIDGKCAPKLTQKSKQCSRVPFPPPYSTHTLMNLLVNYMNKITCYPSYNYAQFQLIQLKQQSFSLLMKYVYIFLGLYLTAMSKKMWQQKIHQHFELYKIPNKEWRHIMQHFYWAWSIIESFKQWTFQEQ